MARAFQAWWEEQENLDRLARGLEPRYNNGGQYLGSDGKPMGAFTLLTTAEMVS
jgi:hypothetical protein